MEKENIVKVLEEYAEKFREGLKVNPKEFQPLLDLLRKLAEENEGYVGFYARWVISMLDAGKIDADIRRYLRKIAKMI